jgi:glycosyltransferase involved in cell wall biosynthesis
MGNIPKLTSDKHVKPLLSIIIPCFNSQNYINDALNSLKSFSHKELEVIIIDDGSTDNSLSKIRDFELANDHSFALKVISQKNKGVSIARNVGIKKAQGIYIGFLDADDIFLDNFYRLILPIIQNQTEEIIEFGFLRFNDHAEPNFQSFKPLYNFEGRYEINEVLEEIHARTLWYSPIRLYKKSLWVDIRFPEDYLYAEDTMTIPKVFQKTKSIFFLNVPLYGYRSNNNSVSSNHESRHLDSLYKFYWKISHQFPSNKILKIRLARTISFFCYELNQVDERYFAIRSDMKLITNKKRVLKRLLFPDLAYFLFPRLYDFFNKIRLR